MGMASHADDFKDESRNGFPPASVIKGVLAFQESFNGLCKWFLELGGEFAILSRNRH